MVVGAAAASERPYVMLRRGATIEERVKPQSDEEFVKALAPSLPEAQRALILPLRRMIAAFGNFEIHRVRSDVTFDDLDIGPADSIDELDLILRLEAVLGFELTESEKSQIPSPDGTRKLPVGRFIRAVCAVAERKKGTSRMSEKTEA